MQDPPAPVPLPTSGDLADSESGLVVRHGLLSAVVTHDPTTGAAVADRLGRYRDGCVTFGGVDLAAARLADVRRTILVSDSAASLFSGRLRDVVAVDPGADEATVQAAMATASAADVLEASQDGYDTLIEERGRSLSGGQRQRLVLARALVADPPVLVLVEPTSAVDAHTEARIADRLAEHRRGRTTVVTTSSPLLLDRVDEVAFLRGGRVVATGTHRQLLDTEPAYRDLVTRGEDE
jgi:ABC-type multidrug transport system fused ATPase/permease subunit